MRFFWAYLYLFFVFREIVYFCWLELVELFRLYLSASLCTLALATFVLPCWVIHVRGSIFCCFLFQTAY